MLLFSLLWLNASTAPKPSAKAAASNFQEVSLDPQLPPGCTVVNTLSSSTSSGKKAPQPKPSGKKTAPKPAAKKQQQHQSPSDSDTKCCSCCCGSSSSNTPDNAGTSNDDFFKPQQDRVQEIFRQLKMDSPHYFELLIQNNFLQKSFDHEKFYFSINCNWNRAIRAYLNKLESTRCQSKLFSVGVLTLNTIELLAVSYFVWGKDDTVAFSLGLSSIGLSILGALADYIKANTLDTKENEAQEVIAACLWLYDILLGHKKQAEAESRSINEELLELRKLTQVINPNLSLDTESCCSCDCSSNRCCNWLDSLKESIKRCIFGELKHYERNTEDATTLREKEKALDKEHKEWQNRSSFHRLGSLVFGIGTSVINAMSNALFVGTSLATRYTERLAGIVNLTALNLTMESLLSGPDEELTSQTFEVVRIISLVATVLKPVYTLWNFYASGRTDHIKDQLDLLTNAVLDLFEKRQESQMHAGFAVIDPITSARYVVHHSHEANALQKVLSARTTAVDSNSKQ